MTYEPGCGRWSAMTPTAGRLPGDDTAESYTGATRVAVCRECGYAAHVPRWLSNGSQAYCSGCKSMVRWVV